MWPDSIESPLCPQWQWSTEELRLLSRSAVIFRYPGELAEHEEASAVLDIQPYSGANAETSGLMIQIKYQIKDLPKHSL